MTIAALVKVTLFGPAADKDEALDGLQRLGCLHLNDLQEREAGHGETAAQHTDARGALQYLRDCPTRRRAVGSTEAIDLERVVGEVLELRERSRALAQERDQLRTWIGELEPWGDFELPDWARDGALRFWFYSVPLYKLEEASSAGVPWQIVSRDHRFAYLVAVSDTEPPGMPVPPLTLEPRSLSKLRDRLLAVERELEALDYRRIGLTLHEAALAAALDEADDRAARLAAARRTLERDGVFAVQGWAPAGRADALREFSAQRGLAMTIEAPGPGDEPPTLLTNPPALRGGEGLITFYMTPAYRAWDPSALVLFAFAGFFAMILADAGYALLLAGGLWAMRKRLGATPAGRSTRAMLRVVVAFSIVYGVISGSYFGVSPSADSWLGALRILDTNDQRLMMWLSIAIGAVHIVSANLIIAWQRRHALVALSSVGWATIVGGGALFGIGGSYETLSALVPIGQGALFAGAPLVLLFTSARPLSFAPVELVRRLVDGLKGATQITKAFGDVLSYLRLFALGLAAFKLAEVFNGLAGAALEVPGVGLLLGALILLVGHGLNFVMGIMSGVVHSLRLNLIEFFSWSLTDEGRPYTAFVRKTDRQIN